MQKMPFWAHFRPALSNFRQKKILFKILFLPAFLFYVSLYQISKKTNEQIPSNTGFRRTDTRRNKYEFTSPFQIKPGVKKKKYSNKEIISNVSLGFEMNIAFKAISKTMKLIN